MLLRHNKKFFKWFKPELEQRLNRKMVKLEAGDFTGTVKIVLQDGSTFSLNDSFYIYKKDDDPKYAVFSEHAGYYMFFEDEVKLIEQVQ